MDAIRNPFVPVAGSPPVELAGRDALLEDMHVALQRARIGRHAKSAMRVGLRGVGKTEWGFHTWEQAAHSPIGIDAVQRASGSAVAALDESFFRVRFDRLTPKEKRYLRAMAELGPGPHRSGDIATCYPAKVTSLAPTRSSLIVKGMIWSPNHGDTAYTVPMFDAFMKRIMPGDDWRHV
jgi:hypothetical protein